MSRVWAIAINTFREAVRDRVLAAAFGCASFVLLFTLALAQLSLHEEERVVHDLGVATISLFAVLVAIFLGSSLLEKEISRKTLHVILPKPIRRHEFLVGKYAGIVLTAAVLVAATGALELWVAAVQAGAGPGGAVLVPAVLAVVSGVALVRAADRTLVLAPLSLAALGVCAVFARASGVPLVPTLGALALSVAEVLVLGAVALFFSSFSTPFLTGALTVGVWLAGRSADELATSSSRLLPEALRSFLHALAWVVPNFHLFVPPRRALEEGAEGVVDPLSYVASATGYAGLYAAALVTFACLAFRRRDLT